MNTSAEHLVLVQIWNPIHRHSMHPLLVTACDCDCSDLCSCPWTSRSNSASLESDLMLHFYFTDERFNCLWDLRFQLLTMLESLNSYAPTSAYQLSKRKLQSQHALTAGNLCFAPESSPATFFLRKLVRVHNHSWLCIWRSALQALTSLHWNAKHIVSSKYLNASQFISSFFHASRLPRITFTLLDHCSRTRCRHTTFTQFHPLGRWRIVVILLFHRRVRCGLGESEWQNSSEFWKSHIKLLPLQMLRWANPIEPSSKPWQAHCPPGTIRNCHRISK